MSILITVFLFLFSLGSACSHVAAVLFKVEACTILKLNKAACTSLLCEWKKSRKRAYPAPLKVLCFKRAKRTDTCPKFEEPFTEKLDGYSSHDPVKFVTDRDLERLEKLRQIDSKAAVFTNISLFDDPAYDSDTDTADEKEENTLPELMTSFYDPNAINYSKEKIKEFGMLQYEAYLEICTENQYKNLTKLTTKQSQSQNWILYRIGRITASNSKKCWTLKLDNPAISTLQSVMKYTNFKGNDATDWGTKSEKKAQKAYLERVKDEHTDFCVKDTGLHIDHEAPYLGASPDGLVDCKCHGQGLLEIKCPSKHRSNLKNYFKDKKCPIEETAQKMKPTHEYYYQVQMQMMVTKRDYCDFFVWSKNENLLVRVSRDKDLIANLRKKYQDVFENVILPELVTRENDPENKKQNKLYCTCQRPYFKPMIACDDYECALEWYHYSCVNLSRAPSKDKKWFCPICIKMRKDGKSKKNKDGKKLII